MLLFSLILILLPISANAYLSPLSVSATSLQGVPVSSTPPTPNYILQFDGTSWSPAPNSGGGGGVTSVGLSMPSIFSVSGSPVTSSGSLTTTLNNQVQKTFFAGPTSGSDATPAFRVIAAADVPTLNQNTTGTSANITATSNSTLTSISSLISASSLATIGTISSGVWNGTLIGTGFGGTGTASTFTQGSVVFAGASGNYAQDNANIFWDASNHRLGIGTAAPAFGFDIVQDTSAAAQVIQQTGYGANSIGWRGRHARGTSGSPSATQSGDFLSFISGRGYGSTAFASTATGSMNILATANFTDASMPTAISFMVTPAASVTSAEAMRIAPTGNVLIGTVTDNGTDKLQVSGSLNLSTALAVGSGGTGTATAFTVGSVVFAGTSGVYSQKNANLFWDNTNNRLGIGTAIPTDTLSLGGQQNWVTGLGAMTHLLGPTDQSFAIAAAQSPAGVATLAGHALTLAASAAIAGTSTPGAAAGGNVTITAGSAASFTSGNAAGGNLTLTTGVNVGGSATGTLSLATPTGITNGSSGPITLVTGNGAGAGSGAGNGGLVSLTTGNGGLVSSAAATAANSGAINLTTGAGGAATSNSGGTGGNSAAMTFSTGTGGSATGTGGTRNGGNSGNISFSTGNAGTGASSNGTAGSISFNVAGTNYEFISSAGLVGINTATPGSTLHVNGSYQGALNAVTSNVTLDTTMQMVTADATSGAITVTLPACISTIFGRKYNVIKIDSSINAVTITRAGSDTINGATTLALSTQYAKSGAVVCSAAGAWYVL